LYLALWKAHAMAQLHAFWLQYVGDREVSEWMLAILAAIGIAVWLVSWHTQRMPKRRPR